MKAAKSGNIVCVCGTDQRPATNMKKIGSVPVSEASGKVVAPVFFQRTPYILIRVFCYDNGDGYFSGSICPVVRLWHERFRGKPKAVARGHGLIV